MKSLYFNLAYVFLFSAKTGIYKQNTLTYTKWSWDLFISSLFAYYKTVISFLSRGND